MVADSLTPDTQATALGFISMSWGLGAVLGAHPGFCMPGKCLPLGLSFNQSSLHLLLSHCYDAVLAHVLLRPLLVRLPLFAQRCGQMPM